MGESGSAFSMESEERNGSLEAVCSSATAEGNFKYRPCPRPGAVLGVIGDMRVNEYETIKNLFYCSHAEWFMRKRNCCYPANFVLIVP